MNGGTLNRTPGTAEPSLAPGTRHPEPTNGPSIPQIAQATRLASMIT
jgi:hypothetical protein